MSGSEIDRLITLLAKLPGLGPRSARRAALHMIKHKETLMAPLAGALSRAADKVRPCGTCGNLATEETCAICRDPRRDATLICVVEQVADLWALERAGIYKGRYHVLGGVLSALDNVGPDDLHIPKLVERARNGDVSEVILAVGATVDGQTTAFYLTERLKGADIVISQLAHGVPVGGELDYLDDGTLKAALKARQPF